jgi:hypothetical protein
MEPAVDDGRHFVDPAEKNLLTFFARLMKIRRGVPVVPVDDGQGYLLTVSNMMFSPWMCMILNQVLPRKALISRRS